MLNYLLIHSVISLLLALVVYLARPGQYRSHSLLFFVWVLLFNLTLPIIGALYTCSCLVLALYFPEKVKNSEMQLYTIPDLPPTPETIDDNPLYSQGGMRSILKHASNSGKRQAAVLSTKQMSDKDAMPILRIALNDLDDDVRLLAYSMLDEKETKINVNIHTLKTKLDKLPEQSHFSANVLRKLTENYWELNYLAIAEGELKTFVLHKAVEYGEACIAIEENLSVRILLGRAYLALEQPQLATDHLLLASESDGAQQQVFPYLADAAFQRGQYDKVRSYLAGVPTMQQKSTLSAVKAYWS